MSTKNETNGESMQTRVVIDSFVFQKIMHWIDKTHLEVSGLGKITYSGGVVRVVDAMLLPQKNGGTHTDIEGDAVAKAMYELRGTPGDLRFWWHSHANMNVFWSGTDWDTIRKISAGGWFLSTVFNKRREMRSCLSMTSPLLFCADELPTTVQQVVGADIVKAWDDEYDKNVTTFTNKYKYNWTPEHMRSGYQRPGYLDQGGEPVAPGKQLALPGTEAETEVGSASVDEEDGRVRMFTPNDLRGYGLTDEQIEEYEARGMVQFARPKRIVPISGPPTDAEGRTGGW